MDGQAEKRPTVLSNCHARLLTREPGAAGGLAASPEDGACKRTARVERKAALMSHHPSPAFLFFLANVQSYFILKTNELFQTHKVNILR